MDVNEVDALGVGAVVTSTTTKESRQLSSPANLGGEAAVDGNLSAGPSNSGSERARDKLNGGG
jgi:hypothetical protein